MNSTNQLLQYSEQERLALISCITSITTIDTVTSKDEIEFVLALIEAADMDVIKKKAIDTSDVYDLSTFREQVANNMDSMHLYRREPLPLTPYNKEFINKTKNLMTELQLDLEQIGSEEGVFVEGSFLEKMVLSLYLK